MGHDAPAQTAKRKGTGDRKCQNVETLELSEGGKRSREQQDRFGTQCSRVF